jgi:hypothetical protein
VTGRRAAAALAIAWFLALGIAFRLHRGEDVGRLAGLLGSMIGALAKDRILGRPGLIAAAGGILIACYIVMAWLGLGHLALRLHTNGRDQAGSSRALPPSGVSTEPRPGRAPA